MDPGPLYMCLSHSLPLFFLAPPVTFILAQNSFGKTCWMSLSNC